MNAPVQTNQKAQLLQNTVEHVDITSFDARPIIDAMRKMSFSSRDTARAADIFNMALEDSACSPWLILAGATSAGGCSHTYPRVTIAPPSRPDQCRPQASEPSPGGTIPSPSQR